MNPTLRQQQTIARPVEIGGFGLWTGQDVRVQFRPAPPDAGLTFVRCDLIEPVRIPVDVSRRMEIPRRTTLAAGGVTVEMVEHVLAACAGMQVDNCEIWVDQPELPGCDGSSAQFVAALLEAGIVAQPALRTRLAIPEVIRVGDKESWVEARPRRQQGLLVEYRLDYGPGPIGRQQFQMEVTPDTFRTELASARTFLTSDEAAWLRSQGLGRRVTYQDVLVFGEQAPIENELRFADECVRHKTLDLIGDMALAGCDLSGHVIAYRSGHRLNAELIRMLLLAGAERTARRASA